MPTAEFYLLLYLQKSFGTPGLFLTITQPVDDLTLPCLAHSSASAHGAQWWSSVDWSSLITNFKSSPILRRKNKIIKDIFFFLFQMFCNHYFPSLSTRQNVLPTNHAVILRSGHHDIASHRGCLEPLLPVSCRYLPRAPYYNRGSHHGIAAPFLAEARVGKLGKAFRLRYFFGSHNPYPNPLLEHLDRRRAYGWAHSSVVIR